MKPAKPCHCLGCKQSFEADYRNAHHQKYCSLPLCQKASKASSQLAWLTKPENQNYHSGPEAVARVRDWQKAHPECRTRQKEKRAAALQDDCKQQPIEPQQESIILPKEEKITVLPVSPALQDFITSQPHVFVGLISHFFNVTLQDDISRTTRFLQQLGEDIANGRGQDEIFKTGDLFGSHAASADAVQLGGSTIGAG